METKCLICNTKDDRCAITLTQWLIKEGEEATIGNYREIHSACMSGKLYIEEPDGFIYGRVMLKKKKRKKINAISNET